MPKTITPEERVRLGDLLGTGSELRMSLDMVMYEIEDIVGEEIDGLDEHIGNGIDVDGLLLALDYDETEDDDDCTCADRSWYGPQHDSACPLAGKKRE